MYNARDTLTGEGFALKKILCQSDEQVEMATQEIQTHKAFAHPNIMSLLDYAVLPLADTNAFEYYLLFPFMEVCAYACVGGALAARCSASQTALSLAWSHSQQNGTLREMIDIALRCVIVLLVLTSLLSQLMYRHCHTRVHHLYVCTCVAISRRTRIPERQILELFVQICRAVGDFHAASPPLAHRDIKVVCTCRSDWRLPSCDCLRLIASTHAAVA